jgi:transcription-repair coupling factor (superfamily II helicase)
MEDITLLRIFAWELTGQNWTEITSLPLFWEYSESVVGFFVMHVSLLQSIGNLIHLERGSGLMVHRGNTISEESMIEALISLGYTHGDASDTEATYSKSGGTLTIRDACLSKTIQLEWFDTELDSIIVHRWDLREHVAHIRISAHPDHITLEKWDELNPVLLELIRKDEKQKTDTSSRHIDEGDILLNLSEQDVSAPLSLHSTWQELSSHPTIIVSGCDFLWDKDALLAWADIHMGDFSDPNGVSIDGSIPEIASIIDLEQVLRDTNIEIQIYTRYLRTIEDFMQYNGITGISVREVSSSRLMSGMWTDASNKKHLIIADDLLSQIFVKKRTKKSIAKHLDLLLTLKPGDYIVHREHGIALFHSVVKKTLGEIEREYMELHYADSDKLFVPLTEIYRVSRYIGDNHPELTRLSGTEWERTMAKTDEEIEAIAADILETSARRTLAKGRAFGAYPEEEKIFQEAFAYTYTLDQKSAIDEIFADMESESPMDRLVSGDVGFGKTEVAMNAIYKAVLSGTQVAVLSPLLVLADEHYETFVDRLWAFGIRVGVMTRMNTPRETEYTLEGIRSGTIDVVVGTHRLISDDVSWKRLGLLVIDEEHKFWVSHKEKIKKIKSGLDILSLSATPIPRSLNLALSGLKKISILATPPARKKPIETIVTKWNESMIARAIEHEFARDGQVIIIHNRIRGMESMEREIEMIMKIGKQKKDKSSRHIAAGDILPDTGEQDVSAPLSFHSTWQTLWNRKTVKLWNSPKIIVTHGQMPPEQIEDRIHAFKKREYNILLTTTIIENGVNFLSANTIIIIDPDEFGLASLHQLRGRVGRKDVWGFCYLMYRKGELATDAKERLITIANNTHLGAGFEIAMRDMEIRGAGDVLGVKQAGKSKDIGLTLYFRMLEERIEEMKNERKTRKWTKIELEISYVIPDTSFQSEQDKLSFYREIENIETLEELEEVEEEFWVKNKKWGIQKSSSRHIDEGDILPYRTEQDVSAPLSLRSTWQKLENQNTSNLFLLLRTRLLMSEYGVTKLSRVGMNYTFDFSEDTDVVRIRAFLDRFDRKKCFTLLGIRKIRVETRYYKEVEDFLRSLVG